MIFLQEGWLATAGLWGGPGRDDGLRARKGYS
jgi:hypothetical protein